MLTVTIDFDDTLQVKSFPAIAGRRLQFFRTLINSGVFRVLIVTARTQDIQEIASFCIENDIRIDGIISHAGDKLAALQEVQTVAHFEDSERIVRNLSENGVNCFYMGEFLSTTLKKQWKASLEVQGSWVYYVKDNNTRGM